MRYRLGMDLGLVLAKGIVLSFVCVIVLMPIFISVFHKALERTQHKVLMPRFKKIGGGVVKARFLIIVLAVLVAVPAFLAQNQNSFLYGESTAASTQTAENRALIKERFGTYNPVVLLVPSGDISKEAAITAELEQNEYVQSVTALSTVADSAIHVSICRRMWSKILKATVQPALS
jgi:predicted RND superfamily exporter protein